MVDGTRKQKRGVRRIMGKLVCNFYDDKTKLCDNEDHDDLDCHYKPDKWTECPNHKLIDEDILTSEWVSDNYNSNGSVRQ